MTLTPVGPLVIALQHFRRNRVRESPAGGVAGLGAAGVRGMTTDDMTAEQMMAARNATEMGAATLLGQMLFEFSRLDMALGLCLVWSNGGQELEALTKKVSGLSLDKKLDLMAQLVEQKFVQGSKNRAVYEQWIESAHNLRIKRNKLVHGRWGVEAFGRHVINVLGLPTSPDQTETPYTLQELEAVLAEMKRLQVNIHQLRDQWPL